MHVLSPILCHLDRLAYLLQRGDVSRIHDRVSMMLPAVTRVLTALRPESPEDRSAWDRYAEPILQAVRSCERAALSMAWPVCRSGLTWRPGWVIELLGDLAVYFALPSLDRLFDTPPSLATFERPIDPVAPPSVN